MRVMRALIPALSVLLALIAAGSIAYIAWDLTSERPPPEPEPGDNREEGDSASNDH